MMYPKILRAVFSVLLLGGLAFASRQETPLAYYVKIPELKEEPRIDGHLENPLWEKYAAVLDSFTQFEPQEGALPSEKTVAYIGFDEKNLYIGVRCYDSNPKAIRANITQRDQVRGDDEISIYLDTFNDQKRAFVFQVNPLGVQSDGIHTEMTRRGGMGGGGGGGGGGMGFDRVDRNWDTFFLADARIDNSGYTVELAIPFKSIRFPNTSRQVWGLQIMRTIPRKNEEIYWYPRSRNINGFLIQSGKIEINGRIEKGKNLEVMPVITGSKVPAEKFAPEAGLNLKYNITSNLTADMTLNPDFSQIEADMPQIDVNQRYALYFPEKRPFFLEGKDLFDAPFELIYARKIIDPRWGMKLTGKVGKTTLGFLSAFDENPVGIELPWLAEDSFESLYGSSPKSLINVFRMKQDLFPESYLGFIFTDKEMGRSWNSLFRDFNRIAGIDGHFKFNNYYRLSFQVVASSSRVEGEKTAIVPAYMMSFNRQDRHLNLSLDWTSLPPDFEASSGFFRRKDIQALNSRVSYSFLPQNDLIVSITPSLEYRRIYDFNKTLTDEDYQFSLFVSGWRQSHIFATFSSQMERYGGINFRYQDFRTNFSSQPFSWLSGMIGFSFGDAIYYSDDPYLGYKTSINTRLTFRPFSNLRFFWNFQNNEFYKRKGGEKVYEVNILSQRIVYLLSRRVSLRLITDYNDYYKKFYLSFLFSYEYRPGTVFYLGIDDTQEKQAGIFRSQGRYYFIKFSYWWRV